MNKRKLLIIIIVITALIVIALLSAAIANAESVQKPRSALKGLAMADTTHPEDLKALGASWWYAWGEYCNGADRCINMVRQMQVPKACNDYLLVGNEPNTREPFGSIVSPYQAVKLVKAIRATCPKTLLIVGNVSADDWGNGSGASWVKSFLSAYGKYTDAIGVHCYTQHLASWCVDRLKEYRNLYSGEMWVTEFGVLDGDPIQFKQIADYASVNFTRYAAYTNRQPHTGEGWELPRSVELVNNDGSLSPIGKIYSQYP